MANLMPSNVHPVERGVRVLGGLALLSLLVLGPVPGWGLAGLAGLIFVATGLAGSCPIYTAVGFSSCPVESSDG